MQFEFSSRTSEQALERMEVEEFKTQDIERLKHKFSNEQYEVRNQLYQLEDRFINQEADRNIYAHELEDIQKFLRNMQSQSWDIVDKDQLTERVIKFLDPRFDLTQIQFRAMRIMHHLYCQHLPMKVDQLQKILRVLSVSWIQPRHFDTAIDLFHYRLGYLEHYRKTPDFKENIIEFISRCDPLRIICDLMRRDFGVNQYLRTFFEIINEHIQMFNSFVKDLDKDGKFMSPKLHEELTLKILKVLDILAEDRFNQFCIHQIGQEEFYTFSSFYQLSLVNISMENFYKQLHPSSIQLTPLQQMVARKIRNSALLNIIFEQYQKSQFNQRRMLKYHISHALKIITMTINQISIKEFQLKVLPFLRINLKAQNKNEYTHFIDQTNIILAFIHLHSTDRNINSAFVEIFCQTKIFDLIINLVENTAKDICYKKFIWNREFKDRDLFWLTITAFEIIKHCRIITHQYCNIHKILENAMKVIKDIEKEEWPKKALDNLMAEMRVREQRNVRPYLTVFDRNHYHVDQDYDI